MRPRCQCVQTLLSKSDPPSLSVGASNGGSGGDQGIGKLCRCWVSKLSRAIASLQKPESCGEVSLPRSVVFAEVYCGSNCTLRSVYIDDFQRTSFCHLQTLVKQQFNFRLVYTLPDEERVWHTCCIAVPV